MEYFYYTNNLKPDCKGCFDPDGEAQIFTSRLTQGYYYIGKSISQITMVYPEVVLRLRVFFDMVIEVESYIPIPEPEERVNQDLVMRFTEYNIHNQGVFFTDSNGLYM